MSRPFIIKINETHQEEVLPENIQSMDIVQQSDTTWHLLDGEKTYLIELVEQDYPNRAYRLRVNGELFDLSIKDKYDQLIHQLGLSAEVSHRITDVKAPMPGLVLEILVEQDDTFQEGDPLLILEAMKMENIIKAPCDGQVKNIAVEVGNTVEKNGILMEL